MDASNKLSQTIIEAPPQPGAGSSSLMQERIRQFDWSATPLGPLNRWPLSLRTTVNILLSSRYAMWMAWGPELTFLCNDAYLPTLGIKQPWALGARADTVWAEIWPDVGPRVRSVLETGQATFDEGLLLFLERSGFPEETYHTFSYSPLTDDRNKISGMLCVVTEETERFIGERRLETLRDVASALAQTKTEGAVFEALHEGAARNLSDLPFVLAYLFGEETRLVCASGITGGSPLAPHQIDSGAELPWPARDVHEHSTVLLMEDLSRQRSIASLPAGNWNRSVDQCAVVPLRQQGQEQPAGFLVIGLNPFRHYDVAYAGFLDLLAGQVSAGLANARAYEAERLRAEALAEIDRAKTTFFSNVSHEFRTPLTLILSPIEELLADGRGDQARQHELLGLAHRNGLRLQKLVNTLLDFARIEAGRAQGSYEPVDLALLTSDIGSTFRSAMEKGGLEYVIDCAPISEPVYVDREMWEKIVLNLLSNAFKFTMQGSVRLRLRQEESNAVLSVEDTGTGIPESEHPHIFERFHRVEGTKGRSFEGTGIGLALISELVKLHSGEVRVGSKLGSGSVFTVSIPLGIQHFAKERLGPAATGPAAVSGAAFLEEAQQWLSEKGLSEGTISRSQEVVSGQRARVLVADDNADMLDYIRRILEGQFEIEVVSNGVAALAAVHANPPDLVLTDVMMPELDGFGLVRALRGDPSAATIPVIMLSARAGEESRVEGIQSGVDDYLIKPFSAKELLARVEAHLKISQIRKAAERILNENQQRLANELRSTQRLQEISAQLISEENVATLYERLIHAAAAILQSDFASIHLLVPGQGPPELRLLGFRGADREFAEALGTSAPHTTTGKALESRTRVVLADVENGDAGVTTDRLRIYSRAGMRAIQATPLIARDGKTLGVISNCWSSPHQSSEHELHLLDVLARQAADLIERSHSQIELRDSEERYRTLFESIEEAFCILEKIENRPGDPVDFRYLEVNPAFAKQTGVTDLVGRTIREAFPDLEEEWLEVYDTVLQTGESTGLERFVPAINRTLDLYAFRLGDPASRRVAVIFEDITNRKKVEQERESARQTAELLNRAGSALSVELDPQKLTQTITDIATELVGAQFGAFFHNVIDERGESYMLYTLSGVAPEAFSKFPMPRNTAVFAPTFGGEGVVRSPDITQDSRYGKNAPRKGMPEGHLPVRSYLAVPVTSRSGDVLGGLFFGHEEPARFTNQHENLGVGIAGQAAIALDNARLFAESMRNQEGLKRANNELRRANSDLEQFAFSASHDLQEPIRNVAVYSQIIRTRYAGALDEKGTQYISFVAEGAQRLGDLVKDLLAYAQSGKAEEEVTEDVDSGVALKNALTDLDMAIRDTDAIVSFGELPSTRVHLVQLHQLFQNLIGNALKYRRDGEPPQIVVAAERDGSFWRFSVKDNGIGIPVEYRDRIFGIFKRLHAGTKYTGTGIGLAICQRIVERNGGRIWVESNATGEGSTFFFTLPAQRTR